MSYKDFNEILSYLAGEFTTLEDRYIFAKIWRNEGSIGKRGKMARVISLTNIGTIPEQTGVQVKIGDQVIGVLDESFTEKLNKGDVFVLGGNTYEFKFSRGMVAQVRASPEKSPTVPSWFSEMLPLSFDLAQEIGKFRYLLEQKFTSQKSKEEIIKFINEYLYVDENAASSIYEYFKEQFDYIKEIPNNKKIIIEHYIDENKKKKIIFHTLFGRRVNDCLSRAVAFAISRIEHKSVEIGINDNGFYVSHSKPLNIMKAFKAIKSTELRKVLELAIEKTEVFKRRFRHCAARSLMILRTYKGKRKRVGKQQVSSMILIAALKRISDDFSILKEAKREVLEDLMDIENTIKIMKEIEDKKIEIKELHTTIPSPFAFNLVLQGSLDILKMEDRTEFLRRMHQKLLAQIES